MIIVFRKIAIEILVPTNRIHNGRITSQTIFERRRRRKWRDRCYEVGLNRGGEGPNYVMGYGEGPE